MTRQWAALVLGVALALAAVDPQRLGSSVWFQPAALAVLASVAAVLSLMDGMKLTLTPPMMWIGAWLAWAAIGAALSSRPGTSLLSVAGFAAIALCWSYLVDATRAPDVMVIIGTAAAVSFGLAAVVSVTGGNGGFGERLGLLFLEPNQLARAAGLILVPLAALWVHQFLGERSIRPLLVLGAIGGIAGVALLLTQSRTGVAAAGLGLVVVIAAQLPHRAGGASLLAIGAVLAVGAVAVLSGNASESINQSLSRSASQPTNELRTLNGRTLLWPEVVAISAERPITGFGLGTDREILSRFRVEGRVGWDPEHTHSLPLQLLLTTGIPGLGLAGMAIATSAVRTWKARPSAERTVALGMLAVLIIDGLVEPVLRVPSFAWFALLVAATLMVEPERATSGPRG